MSKDEARVSERQAIREKRIKLAQVEQASFNTGVADSSGAAGAESSISSQANSAQGLAARQQIGFDSMTALQEQSNSLALMATAAQSVFKIAGVSGGFGGSTGDVVDPNAQMSALNQDPFAVTA